jgi:enoyl-CoA hydratase/carnithine racemase
MTNKSAFALAAIPALGSLSLVTDASAAHGVVNRLRPDISQLGMELVHSSQVGIAAISGTAVGGTTALARAGYGRTTTRVRVGMRLSKTAG